MSPGRGGVAATLGAPGTPVASGVSRPCAARGRCVGLLVGLLVGPQPQPQSSTPTLTPGPHPSPNPNPSVGPPWRRELPGLPALLERWLELRAVSPRADHSCLACCRAPHRSPCVRTSLCCGRPASFGAHEKTAREKCPPQRVPPGKKPQRRTACGGRDPRHVETDVEIAGTPGRPREIADRAFIFVNRVKKN